MSNRWVYLTVTSNDDTEKLMDGLSDHGFDVRENDHGGSAIMVAMDNSTKRDLIDLVNKIRESKINHSHDKSCKNNPIERLFSRSNSFPGVE